MLFKYPFFLSYFRKEIGHVMKSLLLSENTSCVLVKPIISVFTYIHTDPEQRIAVLAEIISDIREPISTEEDAQHINFLRQIELKVFLNLLVFVIIANALT